MRLLLYRRFASCDELYLHPDEDDAEAPQRQGGAEDVGKKERTRVLHETATERGEGEGEETTERPGLDADEAGEEVADLGMLRMKRTEKKKKRRQTRTNACGLISSSSSSSTLSSSSYQKRQTKNGEEGGVLRETSEEELSDGGGGEQEGEEEQQEEEEETTLALNVLAVSLTPATRRRQQRHLAAVAIQVGSQTAVQSGETNPNAATDPNTLLFLQHTLFERGQA